MSEIIFDKISTLSDDTLKLSKTTIVVNVTAFNFLDKDTQSHIFFIPSLDISSYGETIEEATEMLKFSLNDFCKFLLGLTPERRKLELSNLGWKKNYFFNKQFSKAYIDANGVLKNFNIEENSLKIEHLTLTEELA
jgi:hypothetical protein